MFSDVETHYFLTYVKSSTYIYTNRYVYKIV
jgi:hypothetical protein